MRVVIPSVNSVNRMQKFSMIEPNLKEPLDERKH